MKYNNFKQFSETCLAEMTAKLPPDDLKTPPKVPLMSPRKIGNSLKTTQLIFPGWLTHGSGFKHLDEKNIFWRF